MNTVLVMENTFSPAYLTLYETGELKQRINAAIEKLTSCQCCPHQCMINRLENRKKFCLVGRYAKVSSYFPHFGEEDCLRGSHGSGTIFFSGCNLKCVFCQNQDISHKDAGTTVLPETLAAMMIELQDRGCHNINFVTPSHVVPQILEALPIAIEAGLILPLVYNSSGYDSLETLQWLDGVVDIYMPDFKFWDSEKSRRYLNSPDYPEVAKNAIFEMQRQAGSLKMNAQGIAQRGLLIRHLVMPQGLEDTEEICHFLAEKISRDTYLNLMAQYHPDGFVNTQSFPEINRRISLSEFRQAFGLAKECGLYRFDKEPHLFF